MTRWALDIDDKSFEFAKRNIEANKLQNRIKLLKTTVDDPLIPLDVMKFEKYDAENGSIGTWLTFPGLISACATHHSTSLKRTC